MICCVHQKQAKTIHSYSFVIKKLRSYGKFCASQDAMTQNKTKYGDAPESRPFR